MYSTKKRLYKESIVDSFYNCHINGPVIVTALTGPNFDRIAQLAYSSLQPIEINSYEVDKQTFEKQCFQLQHTLDDNIAEICNLYLQDINKCIVSNFMDIDLMGTILTQGNTIRQLLEQQSYLEGTKVFIGTFAIRKAGLEPTLNYIRNTVGLLLKSRVYISKNNVEKQSSGPLLFKHKHETIVTKRIQRLDVYHYSDKEGCMVTFRIIYE